MSANTVHVETVETVETVAPQLCAQAPWGACVETQEAILQGVPELVCSNELFLRAMFEQAGFEDFILDFEVLRKEGAVTGDVRVTLPSFELAQWCFIHFASCEWAWQGCSLAQSTSTKVEPASPSRRTRHQESSKGESAKVTADRTWFDADAAEKSDMSDSEQSTVLVSEQSADSEDTSDDDHAVPIAWAGAPPGAKNSIEWAGAPPGAKRILWADLMDDDEF